MSAATVQRAGFWSMRFDRLEFKVQLQWSTGVQSLWFVSKYVALGVLGVGG